MSAPSRIVPEGERRRIIISDDFWCRRTLVSVEPRTIDTPTQSFVDPDKALAHAEQLSRINGWPLVDRRDTPPEAA